MRSFSSIALAIMLCAVSIPAQADDTDPAPSNVRITFSIGYSPGETERSPRSYTLVAPLNGRASTTVGARVPIPTRAEAAGENDDGRAGMVTSYTYQSVGFSTNLDTALVEGGAIRITGFVELSRLRAGEESRGATDHPVVDAIEQRFDVVVDGGAQIRLLEVDEPGSGITIDLDATVLDS